MHRTPRNRRPPDRFGSWQMTPWRPTERQKTQYSVYRFRKTPGANRQGDQSSTPPPAIPAFDLDVPLLSPLAQSTQKSHAEGASQQPRTQGDVDITTVASTFFRMPPPQGTVKNNDVSSSTLEGFFYHPKSTDNGPSCGPTRQPNKM